jgi:hypothetical protein
VLGVLPARDAVDFGDDLNESLSAARAHGQRIELADMPMTSADTMRPSGDDAADRRVVATEKAMLT